MTSTSELLVTLNHYRVDQGLKPLKAWKESRAKLEAAVAAIPADAIDDMQHAGEDDFPVEVVTETPVENVASVDIKDLEPDTHPAAAANAASWDAVTSSASSWRFSKTNAAAVCEVLAYKPTGDAWLDAIAGDTFTVAQLARACGKKEKVARAKARTKRAKLGQLIVKKA